MHQAFLKPCMVAHLFMKSTSTFFTLYLVGPLVWLRSSMKKARQMMVEARKGFCDLVVNQDIGRSGVEMFRQKGKWRNRFQIF